VPDTLLEVEYVEEYELPAGHEWMLVRKPPSRSEPSRKWLFIKRGADPRTVLDAAAAVSQIHRGPIRHRSA
jgi:hypothetical protein